MDPFLSKHPVIAMTALILIFGIIVISINCFNDKSNETVTVKFKIPKNSYIIFDAPSTCRYKEKENTLYCGYRIRRYYD